MKYGLKLKLYREKLGLTQEEVAKKIDISRTTLSNYENSITPVPITVFINLARLYKCDVFEIMGVHDSDIENQLELDVNPYYLIKAHARYIISCEMKADEMFGNKYSNEYYNSRFRAKIKDMLNNPIYTENLQSISVQENIDDVEYFE